MAHFSFASLFQIGLLFVLICWTKESTGAAFSLEEEFKQFKIQMKEIVENFESKVTELEAKDVEMRDKIAQQDSLLSDLLRQSAPMKTNESAVAINGLPTSCADLKMIGHTLNGIYSIAGSAMMEYVYCDFSKLPITADFQKWIGYVDAKSVPVHFLVQRNYHFNTTGIPIPFDFARVNEGNAMDLTSGIFTAPRPGIYFFAFTGLASLPISNDSKAFGVSLSKNGGLIGTSFVEDAHTYGNQLSPLTFQSTLKLIKGDRVWMTIFHISPGAFLYDYERVYTQFTGFMLEEEIVASL